MQIKESGNIGGVFNATYKRQKKRTSLKVGFVIICLAVLGVCSLFLPMWAVSETIVEGNAKVSSQAIESASMIVKGMHILKINKKETEANIKKVGYIENARIRFDFPNRVYISVKESVLSAYVKFAGGYVGIDSYGKVVETVGNVLDSKVPVITGVKVTGFTIGEKISIDENEKFDIILLCINECTKSQLLPEVAQIDCEDINDIRFTVFSGLYTEFGNKDKLSYKIAMLAKVIEKLGKDSAGFVNLREQGKAVYRVS